MSRTNSLRFREAVLLRLTNLADYAVVLMTAAARRHDPRLSAPMLALETGIPSPTVAKLLGTLARAGLLVATRGVGGGFRLAHAPAGISVAAIIEAIDGPIALTNCQGGTPEACTIHGRCGVRPHWGPINAAVRGALAAVTLAELAGAPEKPIKVMA